MAGYPAWPSNPRARVSTEPATSWSSDAWFFGAWVAVAGYAGLVAFAMVPTAGLAVVGLLPAVAVIVGVAVMSQHRLHTVWAAALVPVAVLTGIAIGAHHFVQGRSCSVSASAVAPAPGKPMHQVVSTTCTTNHPPDAFAQVWPYVLSCVVVLVVAAALAVAFGQGGKHGLGTPPR